MNEREEKKMIMIFVCYLIKKTLANLEGKQLMGERKVRAEKEKCICESEREKGGQLRLNLA